MDGIEEPRLSWMFGFLPWLVWCLQNVSETTKGEDHEQGNGKGHEGEVSCLREGRGFQCGHLFDGPVKREAGKLVPMRTPAPMVQGRAERVAGNGFPRRGILPGPCIREGEADE